MITEEWCIAGGGIGGLTLAYRLLGMGKKVVLLEGQSGVGGLAESADIADVRWDRFYHVILKSDRYLRSLLQELELDDKINWVVTKTGFYSDNNFYSISDIRQYLNFPLIDSKDKFRLALNIFYASKVKNWKKLEKITADAWLNRWSGESTYNKIWKPLLISKLGDEYINASAAFIWATIQRMYAARKAGLKQEMFGYVKGGYSTIIGKLKEEIEGRGGVIKTGSMIREVRNGNRISVHKNTGETLFFDKIIMTIPSDIIAQVCTGLTQSERDNLLSLQYMGVVCVSLVLKKKLSEYYVTNIVDPGFPFTGVIEMTSLVPSHELKGYNLVYLPKYVKSNDALLNKTDSEITDLFFTGLFRMHPKLSKNDIIAFKVSRAKNVFVFPSLHYSAKKPAIKTSIPNLYIINGSQIVNSTLNVNEIVRESESALRNIINGE